MYRRNNVFYAKIRVIVKNSSRKQPVGQQSVDRLPTGYRQATDRLLMVAQHKNMTVKYTHKPDINMFRSPTGHQQLADCRPTDDQHLCPNMSADCWSTVGRGFFRELFFTFTKIRVFFNLSLSFFLACYCITGRQVTVLLWSSQTTLRLVYQKMSSFDLRSGFLFARDKRGEPNAERRACWHGSQVHWYQPSP